MGGIQNQPVTPNSTASRGGIFFASSRTLGYSLAEIQETTVPLVTKRSAAMRDSEDPREIGRESEAPEEEEEEEEWEEEEEDDDDEDWEEEEEEEEEVEEVKKAEEKKP
ncbi:MAG: hypothetical protein ACYTFG_04060, partial [Planctomycetota bacterium]